MSSDTVNGFLAQQSRVKIRLASCTDTLSIFNLFAKEWRILVSKVVRMYWEPASLGDRISAEAERCQESFSPYLSYYLQHRPEFWI
jgi:hypothetical protein